MEPVLVPSRAIEDVLVGRERWIDARTDVASSTVQQGATHYGAQIRRGVLQRPERRAIASGAILHGAFTTLACTLLDKAENVN